MNKKEDHENKEKKIEKEMKIKLCLASLYLI